MKTKYIWIILFAFMSMLHFTLNSQQQIDILINDQLENKIEVIDFHTTHRCVTCKAIEANTKYTLDTYFAKELENGSITMAVLNIDEKENEAISEKFEVYGTSLYLNVIIDGKETPINLTEFAFMKGTDQEAFSKELSIKINRELRKL